MEPSRMRSLLVYLKNMMYSVSSDPSRDQSQFIFTVVPGEIGTRWANPSWIHPTHTYLSNLSCFHPTHTYLSNLSCFHPTLPGCIQSFLFPSNPSLVQPIRLGFIQPVLYPSYSSRIHPTIFWIHPTLLWFIPPTLPRSIQPLLDSSNPSLIHPILHWFIQSVLYIYIIHWYNPLIRFHSTLSGFI